MGLLLSMILVLIPSEYCFMETQPGSLNARGVDIPPTSSFFGHRVELLIFMRAEHKVYKDVSGRSVLYDLKYGATACRGCPLCQIARSAAQQMVISDCGRSQPGRLFGGSLTGCEPCEEVARISWCAKIVKRDETSLLHTR